mgnify:CR=1 FL=1|nr:MAG TPA: TRYPTOPHAN RNA-BINDING ATTENUATOR PROTEIN-INHIBITORY PROTEIN REGULATION, ANTI-TRAP [Caudoviricetes sp.]
MSYELKNGKSSVVVYGCHKPVYVRTDKNGTKIYHDINCPRCAGAGRADKWALTGYTCFECGGSGLRRKPVEVKVYTKEYLEKLEKRRAARMEKVQKPNADELLELAAAARKNAMQSCGLNENGRGFLYTGDTYGVKEELRKVDGRWCAFARGWVAPVLLSLKGVSIVEVSAEDVCNVYGYIDPEKMWDFMELKKQARR